MHDGLSEVEARQRLAQDGPNELPVSRPRGLLRLLREVVTEPMFLLLVACGALYKVLGDLNEALMLLGFVFVVMGITFVQQRRTERSLEALRDFSSPHALVVRDGHELRVSGRELVCGDIVLLAEGDRVPGDMHLVESSNLAVDESMLTGESAPVMKQAGQMTGDSSAVPGDTNPAGVFSGTLVTQGTARGLVTATGERSALGRIGKSLEGIAVENTPIQRETRHIVKRVAAVGLTLAMAILPQELPSCCRSSLMSLLWFEGVKWRFGRRQQAAH